MAENAGVSTTSAGENDNINFTVTYCVFDAETTGDPTVKVTVGDAVAADMSAGESNDVCKNGIDYYLDATVVWANSAQAVLFSAFNNANSADGAGTLVQIVQIVPGK